MGDGLLLAALLNFGFEVRPAAWFRFSLGPSKTTLTPAARHEWLACRFVSPWSGRSLKLS